ncbi:MAG: helix-turn-helix domain-containing protein [Nitrospira sp.]|nr:helix-turn-helix domain-containing protein [Nitrospira sp.]
MVLLTLTETATMLKVSPRTVRRLPITRAYVGGQLRYDLADLEAYVKSRKAGGLPVQLVTVAVQPTMQIESHSSAPMPFAPARLVKHRNPLFAIGGKR